MTALFDVPSTKLCFQFVCLRVGERQHFVLIEIVGAELSRAAPGNSFPYLRSSRMDCRLSFGGCGFQYIFGVVFSSRITKLGADARSDIVNSGSINFLSFARSITVVTRSFFFSARDSIRFRRPCMSVIRWRIPVARVRSFNMEPVIAEGLLVR